MATKIKNVESKAYQWRFYTALNRFPSMIAGWGTGKTMFALLKGDLLNRMYKNNLGLVVRNKFTDLRDSTMKDFTRYTGITVPQGTKEAKYPNGSVTLFRHAKELSGLQNVNVGWFYIEQAEEFPTDTQFTLLRGRLRRDLEIDEEFYEEHKKLGAIRPFHQKMIDKPLRQGMVIANARGHWWGWKMFIKSPAEGYSCEQATPFDNYDNLPADFIKDLKRMEVDSPAKFAQYVMNSHSEVDLEAAYYISAINEARKDGRIGRVPHDPAGRVHLVFDLGFDCTSIGFIQEVGQEIHIIDYYENTGKPISHYAGILDSKTKKYKYAYGTAFMPPDANKREMSTGLTLTKSIKDLGYKVKILEREISVDVGINRVLDMFPRLWIDEEKCEDFILAAEHYRREYDEERKVYIEKPLHDWASHPMDMLRYLSKAIKSGGVGRTSSVTLDMIKRWTGKYRRTG